MAEHAVISGIVGTAWANGPEWTSSSRCLIVTDPVTEIYEGVKCIDFNISGTKFTIRQGLLLKYPASKLACHKEMEENWSKDKYAYYFDRDPALFNGVLNIFRYNMVTIPVGYSEVMFKRELKFWNISWDELQMECSTELDENIEKQFKWMEGRIPPPLQSASIHSKRKYRIWCFLTDPQGEHTPYRKISTAFVVMNIFLTALYMTLFGMFTDSYFRVVENNITKEFEPVVCQGLFECYRKSYSVNWLDISLRVLIVYFLVETALRFIVCPSYKFYLKSVITWFDIVPSICILVILPYYFLPRETFYALLEPLGTLGDANGVVLSTVGISILGVQVLRVFKIFQYAALVDGLMVMVLTLRASLKELGLLVIYLVVCMFVFSTLVTFAELYSTDGIPNCLIGYWWAIVTMTTVGYGDYYPSTPLGYVVGVFCAVTGLIMTALPVAVIGNNFRLYWDHNNKRNKRRETINLQSQDGQKELLVTKSEA